MDKYKKKEVEPLLDRGLMPYKKREKQGAMILDEDEDYGEEENFEDEILMLEHKKWRHVSLLWQDIVLLTLEFLQLLAVVQSMAIRWSWSSKWLENTYFIFIFNLDFWEFIKFSGGSFLSIKGYFMPSSSVNTMFWYIAVGWLGALVLIGSLFLIVFVILKCREPAKLVSKLAWLRRIFLYIVQLLTLPIGTTIIHSLNCNNLNKVDVMNTETCFNGIHWAFVSVGIFLMVLLFFAFPLYVVVKTRMESVGSCRKHHESFLLLKETEYKVGLSKAWLTCDMYLFSSFQFLGMYQRAFMQLVKLTFLIIMAAAFQDISTQAWATFAMFIVFSVIFLILRPYRLTAFNVLLVISFLTLSTMSLFGAMATEFDAYTLNNPWLLPQYSVWLMTFAVGIWLIVLIIVIIYMLTYRIKYCIDPNSLPLWPTFSTSKDDYLSPEARKFLRIFLRARFVLEKTKQWPAIFAPVHDLARQIKILNVYCREAEYLGDALHGIMWNLLDEMIDTHSDLSIRSLFAESVKESIRKTASQFLEVMPQFTQRVAQRDYDLILVNPVKKRMLLKMYCMSVFLNGRTEKMAKTQLLTKPALNTIWKEPMLVDDLEEEGYYEDLYPDPVEVQSDSSLDVSMESSEEEEEISFRKLYRDLPQIETINPSMFRNESPVPSYTSQTGATMRPGSSLSHQRTPSAQSITRPASATSKGSGQGVSNLGFEADEQFPPGFVPETGSRPASQQDSRSVSGHGNEGKHTAELINAADTVVDMEPLSPNDEETSQPTPSKGAVPKRKKSLTKTPSFKRDKKPSPSKDKKSSQSQESSAKRGDVDDQGQKRLKRKPSRKKMPADKESEA